MTRAHRLPTLSVLALLVVLVLSSLAFAACAGTDNGTAPVDDPSLFENAPELGTGTAHRFHLAVIFRDGAMTRLTVNTDRTTVGEALAELDVIRGEEGAHGIYIKSVLGERADYEKDGVYWAFYIGGDYAVEGVDMTTIEDGSVYNLRVE